MATSTTNEKAHGLGVENLKQLIFRRVEVEWRGDVLQKIV
jgi:hypothetical protein